MNSIKDIHDFINLAQKNRKYPPNTAHGKRAALKLFETVLHADELESIDLIEERMKEIYLSLISKHKETFSIQSLNTYKGRFLKTLQDYKRYGTDPQAFSRWEAKARHYKNKDIKEDTKKDISLSEVSLPIHSAVHKIQITLSSGQSFIMEIPSNLNREDVSIITKIIASLAN